MIAPAPLCCLLFSVPVGPTLAGDFLVPIERLIWFFIFIWKCHSILSKILISLVLLLSFSYSCQSLKNLNLYSEFLSITVLFKILFGFFCMRACVCACACACVCVCVCVCAMNTGTCVWMHVSMYVCGPEIDISVFLNGSPTWFTETSSHLNIELTRYSLSCDPRAHRFGLLS